MKYFIWTILGYLAGSVLYACLLPLRFKHIDICAVSDDHNPGAANAFKYAGFFTGLCVIICELLKAFLPVFIAARRVDADRLPFAFIMAAPVIGHAFSVFYKGKGGKAIAASFGVLLALFPNLYPFASLAVFYILFSTVFIITPHLHRSIVTFLLFALSLFMLDLNPATRLGGCLIAGITIYKHLKSYSGEAFRLQFLNTKAQKRRT